MFTLMHSFGAKYIFWAKKYRGVIFHDTEEWYKIWEEELTCCFKVDMGNLMNFDPSPWKSQKFPL